MSTDTPQVAWERRHNTGQRAELVDDLLESLEARRQELHDARGRLGWLVASDAPDHIKKNAARLDAQLEEIGQTLITVRGMRRTRLEYYDFDTANRLRPVEQVHRDHAAHADVCAICRQEDHDTHIGRHLTERAERLRALLGSLALRLTLTRPGQEPPTAATAAKVLELAAREVRNELGWLPEPDSHPAAPIHPPKARRAEPARDDQPALFDA